ncbi:hypothetical protein ALC60_00259 [Trachymyrmex zeteki]|uniref:Uncharacterized protein n=1 Tax=Mycetomoellerius zeteki TaxID=64791 RepID=A0A151XJQ2_9HYME|nr:hypothetical protein ALC60_00259 [Trachymyrmex zeteki]
MLAHHAAPPVNSCPPGVGRGVHPFLYRWTNAPTRNPVPSSAYVAKVLHPLLDSTPRSISFCTTSLLCLPSFYDTLPYSTFYF